MTCPNCSAENPAGAKFCMNCGAAQSVVCGSCGTDLPAGAAFCFSCGARVGVDADHSDVAAGVAPPVEQAASTDRLHRFMPPDLVTKLESAARAGSMQGERRTVTMLFCDVQGSTAAAEKLDPEEWTDIMNGAFEHLIAPVYRFEGTLANLMGDAILAFFGAPIGHEDDPERAVLAGLEIIDGIGPYKAMVSKKWGIDFDVRVGINTGLVVVGAVGSDLQVQYTAMGDAVNVAARMEQTAQPGTIQISEDTKRLVERLFEFEDLGAFDVKGRETSVGAFRVVRALERPETVRGIEGLAAPLVGRDAEMGTLREAFGTVTTGQGRVISVMGEAGLGKSRLVAEFRAELGAEGANADTGWHVGRSLSYETATPYAPVRRVLRDLIGIAEGASGIEAWERIDSLVDSTMPGRAPDVSPYLAWMLDADVPEEHEARIGYLSAPQLRGEAFRATIALVESLAAQRPLVLFFEDLHWADEASVDLIVELLDVVERSMLVLLLLFRPRRQERSWRVHEAAERDHPHRYTTISLSPLTEDDTRELVAELLAIDALPESVRALILAKSEGNPFFVEEIIRSMLDQDLIVRREGRFVATSEVASVSVPDTLNALLTTRLDSLAEGSRAIIQAASVVGRRFRYDELAAVLPDVTGLEAGLVDLQRRELISEETRIPKRLFAFRHALVLEAAYGTVLLKQRTSLHGAVADFVERYQPERIEDIADHLVRARQTERAVPYLVAAGEKAARTYAIPVAIERLEQALEYMDDTTDAALVRRALEALGQAKEFVFDLPGAAAAYRRLQDEGESRSDTPMRISGINKFGLLRGFFFDERGEALEDLRTAEALARSEEDGSGLVEACMNQCYLRTSNAEFDEVEHYMQEVTELGEAMNDAEPTLFGMSHFANTLVYLTRFDEALEQAEKALAKAEELGNLKYQAEILTFVIPTCHLRNGDVETAMAAVERGMEIAQQIGDRASEALAACFQGKVAMERGHLEDALALFRRTIEASDATGVPYFRALGRCVTGTCYLHIGGPMLERALEYHAETLELMEQPTGRTVGAWLWTEIGHCLLAAGKVDDARDLFEMALTEQTAPMYLFRPSALIGKIDVALAEGSPSDAAGLLGELDEYVSERGMREYEVLVEFAAGRVAAGAGDHESALSKLARCEELARGEGRTRMLLDIHAAQGRSFDQLGRSDEALAARDRRREVSAEIAAGMSDDELRTAFLEGAEGLARSE